MNNKNSYSVILPTLNEVGHINSLISDISNNFISSKIQYEIIIVDDNSTDGTINEVKKNQQLEIVINQRIGKKKSLVNSFNEGIEIAKYENIIWMDADYSHPPELIKKFIEINNLNDVDIIVGSRFLKESKRYYDNEKKNQLL